MIQLPDEFTEKMKRLLGEEYGDFLASYGQPRKFGLRVNTLKISPGEFERLAPFHLTKIPWIENGYYYEEQDAPARHPFYYAGLYYLQEPSAMTPASVLPVRPGERVLDLCAAPGGKATELGARLMGRGLLVANDISASRAKALLKNIEVFGITNAFVTNETPARLAERFPEFFDKILVDAPCSGEGMFRKDPAVIRAWNAEKPLACAKQQREIIRRAADMLTPGGMLLYSTCTFSPEENEQIIAGLLAEREDMELIDIPWQEGFAHGIAEAGNGVGAAAAVRTEFAPESTSAGLNGAEGEDGLQPDGRADLRKCVRIFPHKMAGEGHFLALMRKRGGAAEVFDRAVHTDFLGAVSALPDTARLEIRKGQAYYVPEDSDNVRGLTFLRNGLYLGEIKKDRFEPSQSFAMALGGAQFADMADVGKAGFANAVDLDWRDERVYRYLRGETIEVNDGDVCSGVGISAAPGARGRNAGGSAAPSARSKNAGGFAVSGARSRNAGGSAAPGARSRNAGGSAAPSARNRNADISAVPAAKGWYLVCVNGYPLGWGKLSNGMLKNKYHAGWRMK